MVKLTRHTMPADILILGATFHSITKTVRFNIQRCSWHWLWNKDLGYMLLHPTKTTVLNGKVITHRQATKPFKSGNETEAETISQKWICNYSLKRTKVLFFFFFKKKGEVDWYLFDKWGIFFFIYDHKTNIWVSDHCLTWLWVLVICDRHFFNDICWHFVG